MSFANQTVTYEQISDLAKRYGCNLPDKTNFYKVESFLHSQKTSAVRDVFYTDYHGWQDLTKIPLKNDAPIEFISSLCCTMVDYATGARKIDMYLPDVAKALIYSAVSTAVIDPYDLKQHKNRRNMFPYLYNAVNNPTESGWEEFNDLIPHLSTVPSVVFPIEDFKKPVVKKDMRRTAELRADLTAVNDITPDQIKNEWLKLILSVYKTKKFNAQNQEDPNGKFEKLCIVSYVNFAVLHKLCFIFACTALRLSVKEDYLVQTSYVTRMRNNQFLMIPVSSVANLDLKLIWPTHNFFADIGLIFAEKCSDKRPMFVTLIAHQWLFENSQDQALDDAKSSNQAIIEAAVLTTSSLHGMQMVKAFQTLLSTSELDTLTLLSALNNEQFEKGLDALVNIWILCFSTYNIGMLKNEGGPGNTPLNSPILNGQSRAGSFANKDDILKHRFPLYARAIDPSIFNLARGETDVRLTVSMNYCSAKFDRTNGVRRSAFMEKNEVKFKITAHWFYEELNNKYMNPISAQPARYNPFRAFLEHSRIRPADTPQAYQELLKRANNDDRDGYSTDYGKEYISEQELDLLQKMRASANPVAKTVSFASDKLNDLPIKHQEIPRAHLPSLTPISLKDLGPDMEADIVVKSSDDSVHINESMISGIVQSGFNGNPNFSKQSSTGKSTNPKPQQPQLAPPTQFNSEAQRFMENLKREREANGYE